ncbi:hypothetical protein PICMEDRAFT_14242 [Pichia membranifaciens NRRL Y-2026]|uniref:Uncharacterized protein n=1 Tax=Pichia membranifaciens NRRL Y-2026 TaxID=763406 RepID=A0A1E3NT21_9ASCO|nr:hypothetical protein PICMEDRAFT_14242 [Pichia membranifaciens NRRL Y-2026]ODQ48713.1 hypothetical protein PICMEDRAFT_14242 [Pichia membranifaciens NRRL Y-2026]
MMMIAGKPQSIPLTHSQKSSHERQHDINLLNAPKKTEPNAESSPSTPPGQKQLKSKSRSKAKASSRAKQQPQQQQQEQEAEAETQPRSQSKSSSSKRNASSGKIVIPPRSVEVSFNTNGSRGSQRAMLKSTADDLKHSTQDIKNLLVASPSTDGSKPNSRLSGGSSPNSSNASNHKKGGKKSPKSPNSQYAKLNNAINKVARLPDGSEPDFNNSRNHSAPLSRSSSSTSARTSKPNSASSNSSTSTDGIRYAGSSFHAEPKAVTLPKPSFLKK